MFFYSSDDDDDDDNYDDEDDEHDSDSDEDDEEDDFLRTLLMPSLLSGEVRFVYEKIPEPVLIFLKCSDLKNRVFA